MRVSIDSTEPVEQVIRVIEALYGVKLTVATANGAAPAGPAAAGERRRGTRTTGNRATRTSGNGRVRSKKRVETVSNAELRSWARKNGHAVRDRGRIPAAVSAAYYEAVGGN